MKTAADICNVALARVGQRQLIASLTDPTPQAIACNALYAQARDALLASAPWPWATRHAVLADTGETRSGWRFVYALPVDCLAPRYIFAGARPGAPVAPFPSTLLDAALPITTTAYLPAINGSAPQVPFSVEASDDGASRVVVTDQESAELIYTAALETVPAFPPLFVEALAWRLAQDLALNLAVKPQLALSLDAKASAALETAIAESFREGAPDMLPDSPFITVRG